MKNDMPRLRDRCPYKYAFFINPRKLNFITIYIAVLATIEFLQGMDRDLANAAFGHDL